MLPPTRAVLGPSRSAPRGPVETEASSGRSRCVSEERTTGLRVHRSPQERGVCGVPPSGRWRTFTLRAQQPEEGAWPARTGGGGGGAGERCLLHERGPGDRLRSCPSPGGHTAWQKPVISSQAFAPAGRGTTDSTRPSRSQAARRRSGLCFRTQAPPSTWPSGAPQALRSHTHRRQQRRGARSPRAAVHTCWPRKARTAPGVGAEGGRRCMRTRRPHLQPLVSQATV